WISPERTSILTSSSARTPPKVFDTPVRRTAISPGAVFSAATDIGPTSCCERADGRRRGDWATPLRGGGGFRRLLHAFHDIVGRRLVVDFLPGVEERVAGDRCSRQRDISRRRLADQGIGGER